MQGGRVFLFFSVSVEQCAFKQRTKYGTQRWTPGGNLMMAHSDDNGDTWAEPKVALCVNRRSLQSPWSWCHAVAGQEHWLLGLLNPPDCLAPWATA